MSSRARGKLIETKLCCPRWDMRIEEAVEHAIRETIEEAARRVRAAYAYDSMEDAGSQAVADICARIVEAMLEPEVKR